MNDQLSQSNEEWRQCIQSGKIRVLRTGWYGAWDALVAAVTRRSQLTVEEEVTFSVWVKGRQDVKLEIRQAQVELR